MRQLSKLILVLAWIITCSCGDESLTLTDEFLVDFSQSRGYDTIASTDRIGDFRIEELVSSISSGSRALGNKNSIEFTQSEKAMIIDSLRSSETRPWRTLLSDHVIVVPKDTLENIFKGESIGSTR